MTGRDTDILETVLTLNSDYTCTFGMGNDVINST